MSPIDRITYTLLFASAFGGVVFGFCTDNAVLTVGGGIACLLLVRSAYFTAKGAQ